MQPPNSLLSVQNLGVQFDTPDGVIHAVNGINFNLNRGQTLGIVGESGSGKSQSVLAMMGLLATNGRATGKVLYQGQDLLALPTQELNRIRGNRVAMIFQDPMTSLNPYLTVERQMTEVLEFHKGLNHSDACARAIQALDAVKMPEAAKRLKMYPHEFSGGMRQRVMIAMALLCEPDVLIADEPTTALDVTVQAQILQLMRELQRDFGTAIVMITHDLGVVAGLCDEVMVLYGGQVMEQGKADAIFYRASHPYTAGLLAAVPRLEGGGDAPLIAIPGSPPNMARLPAGCPFVERCTLALPECATERPRLEAHADGLRACHRTPPIDLGATSLVAATAHSTSATAEFSLKEPVLSVRNMRVHFPIREPGDWPWTAPRQLKAVDGVSFDLHAGETLGVVGESGCGKSTLARALLNLVPITDGSVRWHGDEMRGANHAAWQAKRRVVQMIFQDPLASLDPRMTVAQIIGEPLKTHHPELSAAEHRERVLAMMLRVGLTEQQINRYAHEFSGGQCQRIGIARALILKPQVVICDEPVSALDVSIQAQIINLLQELQAEMGLALIFIAHDLAVVKHISQRVMVMYLGRAMELASKQALYATPRHPYTQALLSAIPVPDPKLERNKTLQLLAGDLPSPINPPSGCVFRTRCPKAIDRCAQGVPELHAVGAATQSACVLD